MKIGVLGWTRLAAIVAAASTIMLAGCREEEQDRILLFEQDTYQGTPDGVLDDDEVSELRSRALRQQY